MRARFFRDQGGVGPNSNGVKPILESSSATTPAISPPLMQTLTLRSQINALPLVAAARSFDEEDKTIYAHVVYEDGDQEDVDFDELSKIILSKAEEDYYFILHNKPKFE